ncbi:MAG: FecR domain-containing protein [Pseudomonadales bacterium]
MTSPAPNDPEVEALFTGVDQRRAPSAEARSEARLQARKEWLAVLTARRQKRHRWFAVAAVIGVVAVALALTGRLPDVLDSEYELLAAAGEFAVARQDQTPRSISAKVGQPVTFQVTPETQLQSRSAALLQTAQGAELRLAGGTALRWLEHNRVELLAGSIYVDTHERTDFAVHSALAVVEDVGTRYQVAMTPEGLDVAVRSGIVNVETANKRYQAVAAEQQSAVIEITRALAVREFMEPAAAARWHWIHEAPPGYGSPRAGDVLSAIAKDLGKSLRYSSVGDQASLANETYSGSLQGLEPHAALRLLAGSLRFDWQENEAEVVIRLAP